MTVMMASTKLALLVALVVTTIAGFANPAAATSPVEATSGTETTVLSGLIDIPLVAGPGATPCPPKPSTLVFTASANPNRWTLSGTYSIQFQLPPGSGNWYQMDRTALAGSGGTWTGSAPTQPLTGVIGLQARVYLLQLFGGPLDCAKSHLRCIITDVYFPDSTSTYKTATGAPGLPTTTPGDSATIDATSTPTTMTSCTVPWSSLGGTTKTLTDLQLTVQ